MRDKTLSIKVHLRNTVISAVAVQETSPTLSEFNIERYPSDFDNLKEAIDGAVVAAFTMSNNESAGSMHIHGYSFALPEKSDVCLIHIKSSQDRSSPTEKGFVWHCRLVGNVQNNAILSLSGRIEDLYIGNDTCILQSGMSSLRTVS